MTSIPPSTLVDPPLIEGQPLPPEYYPNYDNLVTEDGKPVDNPYSEKQQKLLTTPLYQSWSGPGEGRTFLTMANVALYYSVNDPAIVPDVLLSLDVRPRNLRAKPFRSYFPWEYGKAPDAVFEVVSNREGEELGNKPLIYARMRIPYYIVWDPSKILSPQSLHCFKMNTDSYQETGPWLEHIGLGVTQWTGTFEDYNDVWLRWCDRQGNLLPTGPEDAAQQKARAEQEKARAEQEKARAEQEKARAEQEKARAEQEKARAEQEKARAEQEKARAEKLAAQLRAAGIEPQE